MDRNIISNSAAIDGLTEAKPLIVVQTVSVHIIGIVVLALQARPANRDLNEFRHVRPQFRQFLGETQKQLQQKRLALPRGWYPRQEIQDSQSTRPAIVRPWSGFNGSG